MRSTPVPYAQLVLAALVALTLLAATCASAAPSCSITFPVDGQSYGPDAVDHFGGTANGAGGALDRVQLCLCYASDDWSYVVYWRWNAGSWGSYDGTQSWGKATGTSNWSASTLPPYWWLYGSYYLYAVAYNTDDSEAWAFTRFRITSSDRTMPDCAVTYPAYAQSYYPGPDHIAGTAGDDLSGVALVECQLAYWDPVAGSWSCWDWQTQTWDPTWSAPGDRGKATGTTQWQVTSGLPAWVPRGEYIVCAWATDRVGWVRQTGWTYFTVNEWVPPMVTMTSPQWGVWYLPGKATFTGTASDAGSGLDSVSCYLACAGTYDWEYWNWVRKVWEPYDWNHYAEYFRALSQTGNWDISSGLPDTWPCCRLYYFGVDAYDKCGNYGGAASCFYVGDNVPPVIRSVTASPDTIWPPNHRMVNVAITVNATDNYDPAPVSRITGVTCSEPAGAPGQGNTAVDWQITGDLTLQLRAERAGPSTARVYTIDITCTDACGNVSTGSVEVPVPHDRGR
jgi:hypothetical protein